MRNRLLIPVTLACLVVCTWPAQPALRSSQSEVGQGATGPALSKVEGTRSVTTTVADKTTPTRSASKEADANLKFAAAAFAGHNQLYLGATDIVAGKEDYVLSRIGLERVNGAWQAAFNPLAKTNTAVNGVAAADGKGPLYNIKVDAITIGGDSRPVLTIKPASAKAAVATSAPWNVADVAWSQPDGAATGATTVAAAAAAENNAKALLFMVDEKNNTVMVNGGGGVGTAAADVANNLFLVHTSDPTHAALRIHAIAATQVPVEYAPDKTSNFIFAAVGHDAANFNAEPTIAVLAPRDAKSVAFTGGDEDVPAMLVPLQTQTLKTAFPDDPAEGGGADSIAAVYTAAAANKGIAINTSVTQAEVAGQKTGTISVATAATIEDGSTVDLWWDDHLQRLFVGLGDVKINNADDMAVGVLVGGIDPTTPGTLKMRSIVGTGVANGAVDPADLFTNASQDEAETYIIGGKRKDASVTIIKINKLRTMHTSTRKNYLIVNGGATNGGAGKPHVGSWIYALPILGKDVGDDAGKVAKIQADGSFAAVDAAGVTKVARSDLAAGGYHAEKAVVGVSPSYFQHKAPHLVDVTITDLQVVGNTVLASLAGDHDAVDAEQAGIFASTAIFDKNGNITKWTPWERQMGFAGGTNDPGSLDATIPEKVWKFGFDANTNEYWYLTGADRTTARVTLWNSGDASGDGTDTADNNKTPHSNKPLSSALADFGPVNGMFAFDADTPGFKTYDNAAAEPNFAMMVATGNGKVALVESGKTKARSTGHGEEVFETTQKFEASDFAATKSVYIFDPTSGTAEIKDASTALADLGNIVTAEVARAKSSANNADKGWLFVGGDGGVAVLCKPADGTGWTNDAGEGVDQLKHDDFPVKRGTVNLAWVQLKDPTGTTARFANVRKIIADGSEVAAGGTSGHLYVLTRDALHRVTLNKDQLKDGKIADANVKTIVDLSAKSVTVRKNNAATNVGGGGIDNDAALFTLQQNVDEFFDVALVKSDRTTGNNAINGENVNKANTVLALATSQGVIRSGLIADNFADLAITANAGYKPFFACVANKTAGGADDNLLLGPALRFEFVNSLRGGQLKKAGDAYTAEGNLYTTALNPDMTYAAVYRFAVSAGGVKAVKEPYLDSSGAPTDYFYKIGTIDEDAMLQFSGPMDFVATAEGFGSSNSDFVSAVPMTPDPSLFLGTGHIDLGATITNISQLGGTVVTDSASGAKYVAGEFGVLVNE